MTTNVSNDEIRKELRERARAVAEQKREDGIRKRDAELEELRTTDTLYAVPQRSSFNFKGWLDSLHGNGGQIVEIAGVPIVAQPNTDVASEHGQRAHRERKSQGGKLTTPFLEAMLRSGNLDEPPACDLCGDREALYPDASGQIVLCGNPKCTVGRRKGKSTRKPKASSK